jgi:glucuronokinase
VSTPRAVATSCPARAALAGNPSDGYGGAVVAVPIDDLFAVATTNEVDRFGVTASDPDLHRLLSATADAFADSVGALPPVELAASTTIPRSVGLAGSSALVIAALRSLAAWSGHRWAPIDLAELALEVETDRLGIAAGLQDRLVQAAGELVAMHFDPVACDVLERPDGLRLFVAWQVGAAETSDTVHRSLRRRFDGGDERVRSAMTDLAQQAELAHDAIAGGSLGQLAAAMDRSYELRKTIIAVSPEQEALVETGRRARAAVNSAGSGGSVVGLARSDLHLEQLESVYRESGAGWTTIT